MEHATYVGPLKHLRGRAALLRDGEPGQVLAQFDNRSLTADGLPMPQQLEYEPHARFPTWQDCDQPPPVALGFGWHAFPAEHFAPAK